jgi:hypothetical protein
VIEIDGKPAAVEELSLRCTTLRDFNGYVHFVPNGELKTVTNAAAAGPGVAIDVPSATDQNLEHASTCAAAWWRHEPRSRVAAAPARSGRAVGARVAHRHEATIAWCCARGRARTRRRRRASCGCASTARLVDAELRTR